jgi:hypothetical protein
MQSSHNVTLKGKFPYGWKSQKFDSLEKALTFLQR